MHVHDAVGIAANRLPALSALARHPAAGPEAIAAFRDAQLRRVIAHAYARVPYYRELLDSHGIAPQTVRGVADLPAIPISSKQALREQPSRAIVADNVDAARLRMHRTSGSSGEPFVIRRSAWEEHLLQAFRIRAMGELGMRPSDRKASVGLVAADSSPRPPAILRVANAAGLFRRSTIDCRGDAAKIADSLASYRPDVVTGFAAVVARVADIVANTPSAVVRPRFVMVGGEMLPPAWRARIQQGFRAEVFDAYGAVEFNLLAWQCKHGHGYHVSDDSVVLEVVKEDGEPAAEGEVGEVVATNLHAFTMPFIRYRLGDLVIQGAKSCACGRGFSTISSIRGRSIDYFELPDGELIHPYEISVPNLITATWIKEYRLVQERPDQFVLYAVPRSTWHESDAERIVADAARRLGPGASFSVQRVAQLPLHVSGKLAAFHPYREGRGATRTSG